MGRIHHDDTVALVASAQRGHRRERDRLVARHLALVKGVAARYRNLGLPFDDLVQEGSVGLLEAIDGYDSSRGVPFETYARFRVRRAIRNALTDKSRLIRLPKQIVERRRAIDHAEARLAAAGAQQPSTRELATALGMPPELVVAARAATPPPISLEESLTHEGSPLETVVPDAWASDPEAEAVAHEETLSVDEAVAALPARQREIVTRHFGLGREPEELARVARDLRLSQQRTRAIERDALSTLRERLAASRPQSPLVFRSRW